MKTKSASCDPNEVAIKSLFLGPAAENAEWLESTLNEIFQNWYAWRRQINAKDSSTEGLNIQVPQIEENLGNVVQLKRR